MSPAVRDGIDRGSCLFKMDDEIFLRCLNYKCLVPLLCDDGVLTEEECIQLEGCATDGRATPFQSDTDDFRRSQGGVGRYLLERLKSKPDTAFLNCLKRETEHLGHAYIVALLEKRQFSTEADCAESAEWKKRFLRNQTRVLDVNVQALKPYLMKHQLLTNSEAEDLDSKPSDKEKISYLVNVILETKGPTAHLLFAICLREETSHPTHKELYEALLMPLDDEVERDGISIVQRKGRKRSLMGSSDDLSVAKRFLIPLEMERPLRGNRYSKMMHVFQTAHHSAKWDNLEEKAQCYISGDNVQLKAAALLEMAISYTFRGAFAKVDSFVRSARSLLNKVTGDNQQFLEGRCEHVLSCRYRYSKQFDKAREHTHKAKAILFGTDAGEDSSWAHYCDACVLLEQYAQSPKKDPKELKELKGMFQLAIDHAGRHSTGMDVVKPHSHIRLAQLCMGSTQFAAGITTDREMIQEARCHLEAVDVGSLKQRSQSLYYIFKSDLYVNMGDARQALLCAKRALELGQPNYTVEIRSAAERIRALTTESDPNQETCLCSH